MKGDVHDADKPYETVSLRKIFSQIGISLFRFVLVSIRSKEHPLPLERRIRKGVNTMPWTEEDIRRIEGKFDSFCKTVLRNFARDWYRAKQWRGKNEVFFSELPDDHLQEPIHIDPISPVEKYFFDDLEQSIAIENDALAQALHSLSGRKRQIILLAYFLDWTDQQIGERFHVVRSTVQAARTKALKEMRDLLEKQGKA